MTPEPRPVVHSWPEAETQNPCKSHCRVAACAPASQAQPGHRAADRRLATPVDLSCRRPPWLTPSVRERGRISVRLERGAIRETLALCWELGALATCEAVGLAAAGAALHVDDLAVADREYLEAFLAAPVRAEPLRRADDHVIADPGELGLHLDSAVAARAGLGGQDLTGLVGAVSGGRAFPPQVTVRAASPLAFVCDQVGERAGVASVEGFRRGAELVDHDRIMPSAWPLTGARVRRPRGGGCRRGRRRSGLRAGWSGSGRACARSPCRAPGWV